jgi:ABC-2 type transport system ATP-binding protein
MNAPPVIETDGLTKSYGRHRGIEDVTLSVRPGEVFGFLGPNGAGKTTTIRTLLDLIRPTRGRAAIFGLDTRAGGQEIRRRSGYLPGDLALYEHMTGVDHLRYLGHLRGGVEWRGVEELARRLDADLSRRIGELSSGNRQKVGLIQAFMHTPELLILDEPSSGLDPLLQQQLLAMVREARDQGRTVFLSSHVLAEVEHVADRVTILRAGQLVATEAIEVLRQRAIRRVELHFGAPVPAAAFQHLPGVRDVAVDGEVLRCVVEGSADALVKAAAQFPVVSLLSHEPDLEELFLAYYTEGSERRAA